jgi:hypothetical protein
LNNAGSSTALPNAKPEVDQAADEDLLAVEALEVGGGLADGVADTEPLVDALAPESRRGRFEPHDRLGCQNGQRLVYRRLHVGAGWIATNHPGCTKAWLEHGLADLSGC